MTVTLRQTPREIFLFSVISANVPLSVFCMFVISIIFCGFRELFDFRGFCDFRDFHDFYIFYYFCGFI